jgi:hypothetical protein
MMFWKRKKVTTENPLQDKVAGKIAFVFVQLQEGFACGMQKLFGGMTMKRIKLWLVAFCVGSGGLSVYFFINALVSKPKATFKIDQVRMPQHFDRSGDEIMETDISEDLYQQLQDYRRYMDSAGLAIRPSLQDSMRVLEEMYLQQQR